MKSHKRMRSRMKYRSKSGMKSSKGKKSSKKMSSMRKSRSRNKRMFRKSKGAYKGKGSISKPTPLQGHYGTQTKKNPFPRQFVPQPTLQYAPRPPPSQYTPPVPRPPPPQYIPPVSRPSQYIPPVPRPPPSQYVPPVPRPLPPNNFPSATQIQRPSVATPFSGHYAPKPTPKYFSYSKRMSPQKKRHSSMKKMSSSKSSSSPKIRRPAYFGHGVVRNGGDLFLPRNVNQGR